VMAQRDFGRTQFFGHPVDRAAPHARAQRAHCVALGDEPFHHTVGVLFHDPERNAEGGKIIRKNTLGVTRVLLVQVEGHYFEVHRRMRFQA